MTVPPGPGLSQDGFQLIGKFHMTGTPLGLNGVVWLLTRDEDVDFETRLQVDDVEAAPQADGLAYRRGEIGCEIGWSNRHLTRMVRTQIQNHSRPANK